MTGAAHDRYVNHRIRPLTDAELRLAGPGVTCAGSSICEARPSHLHSFEVAGSASRPASREVSRWVCGYHAHQACEQFRIPFRVGSRSELPQSRESEALEHWERQTGLRSGY